MTETARTIISVPIGVGAFLLAQLSVVPSLAAEYDVGSTSRNLGLAPRRRVQRRGPVT
jgi:hypothetical protein